MSAFAGMDSMERPIGLITVIQSTTERAVVARELADSGCAVRLRPLGSR